MIPRKRLKGRSKGRSFFMPKNDGREAFYNKATVGEGHQKRFLDILVIRRLKSVIRAYTRFYGMVVFEFSASGGLEGWVRCYLENVTAGSAS